MLMQKFGSIILKLTAIIGGLFGMFNTTLPNGNSMVTKDNWASMSNDSETHPMYRFMAGWIASVTILLFCVVMPMVTKMFKKKPRRRSSSKKKRSYKRRK